MRQPSDIEPFYDYWQAALIDPIAARVAYDLSIAREGWGWDTRPPRCGFYRIKPGHRDAQWKLERGSTMIPVAIWIEQPVGPDGELADDEYFVALVGLTGRPIYGEEALEAIFGMAAKNPVTEEAYRSFMETGQWPDDNRRSLF